jgi:glyoxylate/succinic semialdehyde reductase
MMCALSEGIHLTEQAELDPATFVEILGLGAMACPMYKGKGPAMIKGMYPTQFPLKHQHKDVRLACELGKEVGAALPVAEAALQHFTAALPANADDDFSAVLTAVRAQKK